MQKNYRYVLTEPEGKNFDPEFRPMLTPKQMLELGVFGGKYMTDCQKEFPKSWFKKAKLCHERHDPALNLFGVHASQPLAIWKKNGWMIHAAGFNGTAATTWDVACPMKTVVRSNDGKR
jgi:hypothetical protein